MRPLSMLLASVASSVTLCSILSWTECMTLKIQSTELHLVIFSHSCYFKAKESSSSGKYDCLDDYETKSPHCLSIDLPGGAFDFNLGTLRSIWAEGEMSTVL